MIENRHFDKIVVALVVVALVFTGVFMFRPDLLGIEALAAEPEYQDAIFAKDAVTEIAITITEENWETLMQNPLSEEFVSCDVTISGETFTSVGIRTKGNSSLSSVANSDSSRYSFKLKADEYIDGQSFFGLEEFVVNNMQSDATYMKEYLSYEMFEQLGVETPLYAYTNIKINDADWGLYLAIEAIEEDFAERALGSDYGQLYKPESQGQGGAAGGGQRPEDSRTTSGGGIQNLPPGDGIGGPAQGGRNPAEGNLNGTPGGIGFVRPEENAGQQGGPPNGGMKEKSGGDMMGSQGGGADLVYTNDEIESYSQIFENAVFSNVDTKDCDRVVEALKNLNEGTDLETYIDVDEVLRYFAANTAMVNLDSYVSSLKHNYYLYEKDGKLSILPWDLNLSFAGFQSGSASSAVNFPIDTPVTGVELADRPLIGSLLAVEEYKETYHDNLLTIVEDYFESGFFESEIERLDSLIGDYVRNDPTAFYTADEYLEGVKTLKAYGALRAESLRGQLAGTVPSTEEAQAESAEALIDPGTLTLSAMGSHGSGEKKDDMGRGRLGEDEADNSRKTDN